MLLGIGKKVYPDLKIEQDRLERFKAKLNPLRECKIADNDKILEMVTWTALAETGLIGFLSSNPSSFDSLLDGITTGALLFAFTTPLSASIGIAKRHSNKKPSMLWKSAFNTLAASLSGVVGYIILSATVLREAKISIYDYVSSGGLTKHLDVLGLSSYGMITASVLVNIFIAHFFYVKWRDKCPLYYAREISVREKIEKFEEAERFAGDETEINLKDTIKQAAKIENRATEKLNRENAVTNLVKDSHGRQAEFGMKKVVECNYFLRVYRTANARLRKTPSPEHFTEQFSTNELLSAKAVASKKAELEGNYAIVHKHVSNLTKCLQGLEEHYAEKRPVYLGEIKNFVAELMAGNIPPIKFTKQPVKTLGGKH